MVSTLVWVLSGLLLYTLVATALQSWGVLPSSVRVSGPITTIHTQRGKEFLDWLAGPKRFWRAWANVGVGIALVVMAGSFLAVLFSAVRIFNQPESTVIRQPQDALVIPGVNQFLPLSVAPEIVFGLLVGLVVHEGGHGLLCRVEDIDIESMGLALLAVIPMGAFVEPDEESQARADRGDRTRMFAAGVTNNFAITVIAFALLFGPVVGSIAAAPGVPVGGALNGTPAADAGIDRGDVITHIDGQQVANASEFDAALADANRTVAVSLQDGNTTTVQRSVVVTSAVVDGPLATGTSIEAVNGTAVGTENAFHAALENRSTAQLSTDNGTVTMPVGAAATVTPGGPLANASDGLAGESVVVTRIAGERTPNRSALSDVLDGTEPNERVRVEAVVNDDRGNYSVQLNENPDTGNGFLGVRISPGTTGIVVDDFGIQSYPASQYLGLLGGGGGDGAGGAGGLGGSLVAQFLAVISLPFAGAVPGSSGLVSFAGFVGPVRNYFTITGPLSFLGGSVFTLANVLFWTGWINVNLGLFNCIPSFPLDGGHIFRASTEAVVSRLPIGSRQALAGAVTTAVTLTMIGALVVMIFGPTVLAG
ncbi:site-2 protease family protein [Halococcus saccharolyticus]|uniref:Peptidase M50 n=1 Tax=Halococcus saccharolyticus DSM 5350 TaxID=1227455 RepID=M0MDN1_9EURY|nr:site-2 protease family protein [Halococcus saccharolyticus]EMA43851.1 peptidase M50 [Halococcus saccharolyticus DSM 5350]